MATPDISTLIDQLHAGPDRARAEAAAHLESLGSAAVPALLEALGHADPQVRHRAVWALEEIDAPEAAPGLVGRLYDAHPKVRLAAVFALGRLATRHGSVAPRAVLGLRDSLLDYEPVIRQKAAQALGEIGRAWPGAGERALWGLIETLRDDAALVRAAAATSLGQLADARATRALLAGLDDDQAMVRLACLDALAEVRDISTIPALRARLSTSPSRAERLAIIDAMEAIGGVRIPWAERMQSAPRPQVPAVVRRASEQGLYLAVGLFELAKKVISAPSSTGQTLAVSFFLILGCLTCSGLLFKDRQPPQPIAVPPAPQTALTTDSPAQDYPPIVMEYYPAARRYTHLTKVQEITTNATSWSPDGTHYVLDDSVYDAQTGEVVSQLDNGTPSWSTVDWSSDGNMLAAAPYRLVFAWNPNSGTVLHEWNEPTSPVTDLAWSPGGAYLASTHEDGTVIVRLRTGSADTANSINVGLYGAHSLAWSPTGLRLAVGDGEGTIHFWQSNAHYEDEGIDTGGESVESLAWSPDGNWLAAVVEGQGVIVWNMVEPDNPVILRVMPNSDGTDVTTIDWSRDGSLLAIATERGVFIWQAAQSTWGARLPGSGAWAQWLDDGSLLTGVNPQSSSIHDGTHTVVWQVED